MPSADRDPSGARADLDRRSILEIKFVIGLILSPEFAVVFGNAKAMIFREPEKELLRLPPSFPRVANCLREPIDIWKPAKRLQV